MLLTSSTTSSIHVLNPLHLVVTDAKLDDIKVFLITAAVWHVIVCTVAVSVPR
jgi:hypothetical protein